MKKLLLTMLLWVGVALVGMATPTTWISAPTSSDVWKQTLSTYSQSKAPSTWTATDNGLKAEWAMSYDWESSQFFEAGATGIKFGNKNNTIRTVTLSTSDIPGTISKVIVKGVAAGSSGTASCKVTVGTDQFTGNPSSVTGTSNTDLVFTGNASGKITIIVTEETAKKQLTIKGLEVTYDNGGVTPPVTTTVTPPTITITGEKQGNDYLVGATATISAETEMIQYTLDGTTPTTENGELYTEPIVLDKAQKYTIKAIALDDDFNASEVKALEVNIVEKTVTPPAGDTGIVVFIADGYTYTGTADIKVTFSGTQTSGKTIADQTWIAGGVCKLDFTATSKTTSYTDGSVCRWYSGDGITITPNNGITITGLKMKSESGNNSVCSNQKAKLKAINNIDWTYVSTTEATWTGSIKESFTFENTAQVRFQYLEITYEKAIDGPKKPTFSLSTEPNANNEYPIGTTVSISAEEGCQIYYNINAETDPTEASEPYTAGTAIPLGLGENVIKAIAVKDGKSSAVAPLTVNVVKKSAELKWSSDQCKVYLNETPTFPTLSHAEGIADNEIVYSIPEADNGVATIDAATGEITIVGKGTTTVTAKYTAPEGSNFADGEASYTLTVTERPAGDSMHATSYMFDFTTEEDFKHKGSYGMTFFSNSYNGTDYETDMENPITKIIRKGVTLDFIVPEGSPNSYRLYQGTAKKGDALRVYNVKLQFSVPTPGRIKSIVFHKGGNNAWKLGEVSVGEKPTGWDDEGFATWTAPEDESVSSVWFYFNETHTRMSGITVEYDLGKPATPYVVSETADEIVVECESRYVLHYTKMPETAAKAPSRAQLSDGTIEDAAAWVDHGHYQITIDKNNEQHKNRGYSFTAYHGDSEMRSDALNLYIGNEGTLTGVEGISAEADADAPVEFYDLQGRMVANPQGGIFIRRQGSKVTKVAL